MIIIFVILLTTAFSKQDKYIDRLPNEEDFLNEVSKRMMIIDDYIDQLKENNGKIDSELLREHKDNNTDNKQENTTNSGDLAVKPLKSNNGENTYNNNEGLVNEKQNFAVGIKKADKNDDRDNSNVIFITKNKAVVPKNTAKAIQPTINTATNRTGYNGHLSLSGLGAEHYRGATEITKSPFYKTAVTDKKTTKKTETIKLVETITELDVDDANNNLDKTKLELQSNKVENPVTIEKNELSAEDNQNVNHYRVYEIPWPNKPENQPFFRNPVPINDPRFKIPLFKYFLKNPNYAKKILISNDKNSFSLELESESDEDGSGVKNNTSLWRSLLSKVKFIAKLLNKKYFKSNKNIKLHLRHSIKPSSNEIENDGLKTHIRNVRDIFKTKPLYYDTNPINNDKYIESVHEFDNTLDNNKKTAQSPILRARHDCLPDIDIDYYFGRMNRRYKKCKHHMAHQLHNHLKSNLKKNKFHFLNQLGHYILDKNIGDHFNFIFGKHKPTIVKKNKHKYEDNKSKSGLLPYKVNIDNVKDMNFKSKNGNVNIETHMKVLKYMILQDNKALKRYDWLKTTVQIQQALPMMIEIIKQMRESRLIHSEDIEFLKQAVFINNLSSDIKKANDLEKELKKFNKKQKTEKMDEVNNLISQNRINFRTLLPNLTVKDELSVLNDFLLEVQNGLFDFHEALMHIAKVTKFNNQHWYDNLKELYLTSDEKHLREILLHISFSRLLDLVENGRQNGLQDDYVSYVKNNAKESKRIVEEIIFVSEILDEIKRRHIVHNNIDNVINFIFGKHKPTKVKKNKYKYEENKSKSDLHPEKNDVDNEKEIEKAFKIFKNTNLKSKNTEFDVNIKTYMTVLKDMILQDNKALKQYDWLKTTVQIQQALSTMVQVIKQMRVSKLIHSEDIEFLKHTVFINNLSSDIKKASDLEKELKNFNTKQKIVKMIEVKNFINQNRINLRTLLPDLTAKDELSVLNDFLLEVQDGLFDLHEALMHIAKVTQFNNQHWYDNLKELYLTSDEKHLREILLHISFSRLLELVENGRQNGLQDDYVSYVKRNPKESKRIVEEIIFVSEILDEIKSNLN